MDSKTLRKSLIPFALVITVLFLASCTPPAPVKPWDSKFLNQIKLSFIDTDTDANEVAGDVLLNLNNAPKPTGIGQYVLYWGSTAGDSGKGDKIAEVSVDISGNLLYSIPQDTAIPSSRNQYFLLYLKDAAGKESYSGISAGVTDETQSEAEKEAVKEAARVAEAAKLAETAAAKVAEAAAAIEKAKAVEEAKEEAKAEEAKAEEAKAEAAKAEAAKLPVIVIENVLFEYDKSDLKLEFKTKLINSFAELGNKYQIKVVISGHADERGSNEYNLALGERRAFNVKRFLISLGLLEQNISVISYGEEKPVDPRSNESAWEKNRRAETDINN